jgi:hypothetical protein
MAEIDTLLQSVLSMSANEADLEQLHNTLKQSEGTLKQNAAGLGQAIGSLNFDTHSLGALYLISAKFATLGPADVEEFFNLVRTFIEACSAPQIKMAPVKCESLISAIITRSINTLQSRRLVQEIC